MKIITPSYYKNFKCTSSACKDNCCIGWEIDVDPDSYSYYKSVPGDFGERLIKSIAGTEDKHFVLKNERCPFLNNGNLCDIILNLGDDKLCEICTHHPRFYEWFATRTEAGISLCCEEACRLIFESEKAASFDEYEDGVPCDHECDNDFFEMLLLSRRTALHIVKNRKENIEARLSILLDFATELQQLIDNGELLAAGEVSEKYFSDSYIVKNVGHGKSLPMHTSFLKVFQNVEHISDTFPSLLKEMIEKLPDIIDKKEEFTKYYENKAYEYEHLTVYFIFRYFLKSLFDGDLLSKVKLAIVSFVFIKLMDTHTYINKGEFGLSDRIFNVKEYSKEIEYSQENIDFLAEEFQMNKIFSQSNLKKLL